MLAVKLIELSQSLTLLPNSRKGKAFAISPEISYEIILAWFIRFWFISQYSPSAIRSVFQHTLKQESSFTEFQLFHVLFVRGLHEPSARQRSLASQVVNDIQYVGPNLEPQAWWEETIHNQEQPYHLPKDDLNHIIDLAQATDLSQITSLFPHVLPKEFSNEQLLVTSDKNAIRAKVYGLASLQMPHYDDRITRWAEFDETLTYFRACLPPEGQNREYKSSFRFDPVHKQKNSHQQLACIKTICGFLNSLGGDLVLGVTDAREVIGMEGDFSLIKSHDRFDSMHQIILEAVKTHIQPTPVGKIEVSFVPFGENHLCVIRVLKSGTRHFVIQPNDTKISYYRDGNRTIKSIQETN